MSQSLPKIFLRPLNPSDADIMYAWRQEPSVQRFNPLADLSLSELRERYAKTESDLTKKDASNFCWMVNERDAAVGYVALNNANWRMCYGEIGYGIAESHHGKGLGTLAVKMLAEKVFKESNLERLIAYVSTENLASWKLLERLGFQREGTLRQHYIIKGRRVDEYVYGILRSEWIGDN